MLSEEDSAVCSKPCPFSHFPTRAAACAMGEQHSNRPDQGHDQADWIAITIPSKTQIDTSIDERSHDTPLELTLQQTSHFLHSPTVDTKIGIAHPCCRPEVNGLRSVIKQDLDIINKAQQETPDFIVKVDLLFLNQLGAIQFIEDLPHNHFGFVLRLPVSIGCYPMARRIIQVA